MKIPPTYFVMYKLGLYEILLFYYFPLNWFNLFHHLLFLKDFRPVYIIKPWMILNLIGSFYTESFGGIWLKQLYYKIITFSTKSFTYFEYSLGNCLYLPLLMLAMSCYLLVSQNGGRPVKHS